jgi:DNA methyltransferase 1-associated protein 1
MGDVADMLGVERAETPAPLAVALGELRKEKTKVDKKPPKPAGMSREVYALLGKKGLPPSMPSKKHNAFKGKREDSERGALWEWTTFNNSGRPDGALFKHWVKSATEQTEYPYARYNVRLDPVTFTAAQYDQLLADPAWTKADTEQLVKLCAQFDLCWPVIADR